MMSTISSVSNWPLSVRSTAPAAIRPAAPAADRPSPSTIVSLSPGGLAAARQAAEADAAAAPPTTAARFKDLGAAMLDKFTTGAVVPVDRQALPGQRDNTFTLEVVTARGVKVGLTLANAGEDMIFQVGADGDLGEDERAALAGLARGFQAAIDGMAMQPPRVRLGELAGFGHGLLQSVDFHAEVALPRTTPGTQSLDFHIDGDGRKLDIAGPSGKVAVAVDTATLQGLGTRRQQDKAIGSYLEQFDAAAARGHADAGLTAMFKDAFADMSRTAPRDDARATPAPRQAWALSKEDHAVLTGLSDFSASVTQAPQWSNPLRHDEVDGFEYAASQDTRIAGDGRADGTITQVQSAHLRAQYHEPLARNGARKFDGAPEGQNYDYHQIDDTASSKVELGYRDGKLRKATLEQSAEQSERIRKVVPGRTLSDRTTPSSHRLQRDLLPVLAPWQQEQDGQLREAGGEENDERRRLSLDALAGGVFLLGTSAALKARDREL